MTCNYPSQATKFVSKQNAPVLITIISCKSIRNHINSSWAISKEYELPIAEDRAGDYTCKVTVGAAVSAESASFTIATTGLSLGMLNFSNYKH